MLAVALLSAPSHAQPAGAQAEVLFREGLELMDQGKYAEACASFEGSQKLDPTVSTLLNLADCREKNAQAATAWGLFLEAERQTRSASDKATQALHKVAQDHAANLEPRVSKLKISVPEQSKLAGLGITRDTERIDVVMWNRALPIDGGTYRIAARAPGNAEWSTTVTVAAEGDTKEIEIPRLRAAELGKPPDQPGEPLPQSGESPAHSAVIATPGYAGVRVLVGTGVDGVSADRDCTSYHCASGMGSAPGLIVAARARINLNATFSLDPGAAFHLRRIRLESCSPCMLADDVFVDDVELYGYGRVAVPTTGKLELSLLAGPYAAIRLGAANHFSIQYDDPVEHLNRYDIGGAAALEIFVGRFGGQLQFQYGIRGLSREVSGAMMGFNAALGVRI